MEQGGEVLGEDVLPVVSAEDGFAGACGGVALEGFGDEGRDFFRLRIGGERVAMTVDEGVHGREVGAENGKPMESGLEDGKAEPFLTAGKKERISEGK